MRVSQDVLAVLDRATMQGSVLSLATVGTLDRPLYVSVNKVLEAAGGKWNRKVQGHVFEGGAEAAIEPILLTGEVTSARQELQQFYTPEDLARRVVNEANIQPRMRVLEPSAGRGALAAPAFLRGGLVHCVELDARNVTLLASIAFSQVVHGDFLANEPDEPVYDRVVMNPPFTRDQDIRHVQHALRFLKPGGRLVAIMSGGIVYRRGRAEAFRALVEEMGGTIERLPDESFKASGTSVHTCLVVIDKPETR